MKGLAKTIISTILGLVLLAGFASAKKVTLRVMHMWETNFLSVQKAFDKEFMKRHPDIEIKLDNSGGNLDKYVTMAAAGASADVIYVHWSYAQNMLRRGLLTELTPYIKRAKDWAYDDFYPIASTPFIWRGKTFGIPYDAGPVLPYYNVSMLSNVGIKIPYNNWSYDDFLLMAKKATKDANNDGRPEQWGLARFCDGEMWPGLTVKPWGGEFLSEDEQSVLCSSKESIAGIRWWTDLKIKHNVASGNMDDFPMGKAAFTFGGSWMLDRWLLAKKITADVCHAPTGPKGQFAGIYGSGYCIPAGSKNKEAAWIYLKEYLSAEGIKFMWGDSGRGSPARKSAWAAFEEAWKGKNVRAFREAIPYCTYGTPMTPVSPRFNEMFWREINAVIAKKKSVEQAVLVIKKEGEPILHQLKLR